MFRTWVSSVLQAGRRVRWRNTPHFVTASGPAGCALPSPTPAEVWLQRGREGVPARAPSSLATHLCGGQGTGQRRALALGVPSSSTRPSPAAHRAPTSVPQGSPGGQAAQHPLSTWFCCKTLFFFKHTGSFLLPVDVKKPGQLSWKHHGPQTTGTPEREREAEPHHEHGYRGRGAPRLLPGSSRLSRARAPTTQRCNAALARGASTGTQSWAPPCRRTAARHGNARAAQDGAQLQQTHPTGRSGEPQTGEGSWSCRQPGHGVTALQSHKLFCARRSTVPLHSDSGSRSPNVT